MDGKDFIVIENIKSRRSVRSFREQPVSKELMERIVGAGRFAPSALNRQPWKIIVIDDKNLIQELSQIATARLKKLYKLVPIWRLFFKDLRDQRVVNALKKTAENPGDTIFYSAPVLILIANDTRFKETKENCYLAAQNMVLAAHSLGIGSCFIGRGRAIPKKILRERFNLPSFYDINLHLVFGYPKEYPKTPPVRKEDAVQWV